MKRNNLFNQKIKAITNQDPTPDLFSKFIELPQRYYSLYKKPKKDNYAALNEIQDIVNALLYREEEYGDLNLDKFGRFRHDKNFLVKQGIDQSPIVDELVHDVIRCLNLRARSIWPEGKKAAVCLTHDVDSIDGFSYFWLRNAYWKLSQISERIRGGREKTQYWASLIKKWKRYKRIKFDPIDSFDKILAIEDKYGFRSTFFFMSLKNGLSREGRRYSVKNPKIAEISKIILSGGWEIGLHAAYHNNLSVSALKTQKHRLEDVIGAEILGCRHHYLRVRFPDSWEIYTQAGLNYSSNMGWGSGFQGFRAGTCWPYQPIRDQFFLEIPFQLMDTNPIIDTERYIHLFRAYLNATKHVGGCLVVNFHQENYQDEAAPGVGKVYRNLLEIIKNDKEIMVPTMKDILKMQLFYNSY